MSDRDYAKLTRALVEFAQQMLAQHNGFIPFAATLDMNGNLSHVGADIGTESPDATAVANFLAAALHASAKQGNIIASGICLNVRARLPGYPNEVDAICCRLEHAHARPAQVFVPHRQTSRGQLEYDKPVALPGTSSVFQPS